MAPCPSCGETRRLGPDGYCRWRDGCEHRRMVSAARQAELDRILEPQRSWQDQARDFWPTVLKELPYADVEGHDSTAAEELLELVEQYLSALTDQARARGLIADDQILSIDLSPLLPPLEDD